MIAVQYKGCANKNKLKTLYAHFRLECDSGGRQTTELYHYYNIDSVPISAVVAQIWAKWSHSVCEYSHNIYDKFYRHSWYETVNASIWNHDLTVLWQWHLPLWMLFKCRVGSWYPSRKCLKWLMQSWCSWYGSFNCYINLISLCEHAVVHLIFTNTNFASITSNISLTDISYLLGI